MSFGAGTFFQILTTGSDTANGGGFDTSNTNFAADGAVSSANTSAPVFSSASYNFVSGDVGARIYIKSGSSCAPGWYTIFSVASNNATLTAGVGTATLATGYLNSIAGCVLSSATTSLSTLTWSVDYSQQASPRYAYTDIKIDNTTNTKITSAAHPFGVNCIGNILSPLTGTGFTTAQRVEIVSISGVVATCDKTMGTTGSTGGTGGLGGALASLGQAASLDNSNATAGTSIVIGGGTYTLTSTSTNAAGGLFGSATAANAASGWKIEGYSTVQGDGRQSPPAGTPIISSGATSPTNPIITLAGSQGLFNLILDGASTSTTGVNATGAVVVRVTTKNFGSGIVASTSSLVSRCIATGCTTVGISGGVGMLIECEAYANSCVGISLTGTTSSTQAVRCYSYSNTGASSDGFLTVGRSCSFINCVAYANGRHGFFDNRSSQMGGLFQNCISEGNSGFGFASNTTADLWRLMLDCATYNNTSGATNNLPSQEGTILNTTGTFFNGAGSGDFSLNNLSGQGALARGAGYPGKMPRGTTTGFLDIGAAQHADPDYGSKMFLGMAGAT